MEFALIAALVLCNLAYLGTLIFVLHRVDSFMRDAMIYMKSTNISDVLSASSILSRKPKSEEESGIEVVPGQDDEDELLIKTQKAHRKHLESLGA